MAPGVFGEPNTDANQHQTNNQKAHAARGSTAWRWQFLFSKGRIQSAVDGQVQFSAEVTAGIARCADALDDLPRLRVALDELRALPDAQVSFVTAVFDLERARRGDAGARGNMLEVADQLLVFWRAGTGTPLAAAHPVLQELWENAATLLASFETKRFAKALKVCWDARREPMLLKAAVEELQPEGNRRVEFARCLYHLELARQFVDSSRVEFARRAGLLAEAYQSPESADMLIGSDTGLRSLWVEVEPYLDEFFENLENATARRRRAAEAAAQAEIAQLPAAVSEPAAPPPAGISDTLDPDIELVIDEADAELAAGAPAHPVPSFTSLMAVPPMPADLTPPGSWRPPSGVLPMPQPSSVPPPVVAIRPSPPAADDDLDLVEVDEAPPIRRSYNLNLDVALDEDDPDEQTIAFWKYSNAQLSLLPDPRQPREAKRLLNADSRTERKALTTYLEGLEPWLHVDDARAFSALIRLMLAGQLKEKSLFGQSNTRRAEAFAEAFALLAPTPRAAGHAAVWFVMDGPETVASLNRGLEELMRFLAFCARERKDPLDIAAQKTFVSQVSP